MSDHAATGTRREEHEGHEGHKGHEGHEGHGRHGWMMIACCIPMLAIALALVVAGVVSAGFLLFAVACTALMALMMRGMDHGGQDRD